MKSYIVRAKCKACNGEFSSLVGTTKSARIGQIPEHNGETYIQFRSDSYVLAIFEPCDLVGAAEFLGCDVSDFAAESLIAFSSVLATAFLNWTAEVIAGDFREDLVRDPLFHRSELDSSLLTDPVHEENKLKFFVRYECDIETRIAKVEFDLKCAKFEQITIAVWKNGIIRHVGDDGRILRIS